MSDDEQEPPAIVRAAGRLSRREKAILSATATVCFVAGVWIGFILIPDAALDVPKDYHEGTRGGYWNAAYVPVPGFAIGLTALVVVSGAWITWRQVAPSVVEGSA